MNIGLLLLKTIYFMLPIYFANMSPVIFRRFFKFLAVPLDFGKKINGKRILGENKTVRGVIFATVAAAIIFFVQKELYSVNFFHSISVINYDVQFLLSGVLMGFGAILGDSVKSFFKRRFDIKPGQPWIPFDQLDFVLGGILFTMIFFIPLIEIIITAIILSPILHLIVNYTGYLLRIRKTKL